jgi:hypothetical protein
VKIRGSFLPCDQGSGRDCTESRGPAARAMAAAAAVFLFEPGAAYTAEIQATLDSHERLKLFPIAIGERDGPATFHVHPDPHGCMTPQCNENKIPVKLRITV